VHALALTFSAGTPKNEITNEERNFFEEGEEEGIGQTLFLINFAR
jgi:hypothetical protein